jgi:hypothetical protein
MDIDIITYGNPNIEQVEHLKTDNYLGFLFDELSSYRFPANSSEATKEELNEIVDNLERLSKSEDHLKRYVSYDRNLSKYFIDGMIRGGIEEKEIKELIESIMADTKPLLSKLKFFHQRPRPFQLAEYYKLKLFPHKSFSSDSPSFPSGHAFQGKIITEVLGNRYPNTFSFMQDVFKDICYSRAYMGLHYQSDIDVGIFCAEKVLGTKVFMEKYKL